MRPTTCRVTLVLAVCMSACTPRTDSGGYTSSSSSGSVASGSSGSVASSSLAASAGASSSRAVASGSSAAASSSRAVTSGSTASSAAVSGSSGPAASSSSLGGSSGGALSSSAAGSTDCPPVVGNCYVFRPDDEWNRPIDSDPVDYQSDCIVAKVSSEISIADQNNGFTSAMLRLDLGTQPGDTYGMPYNLITGTSPALTQMTYGTDGADYSDESDWYNTQRVQQEGAPTGQAWFPFPQDAAIEGWGGTPATDPSGGDRHVIVVDGAACMLYESWNTVRTAPNGFMSSNTAIWDMHLGNDQRPAGWTAGDAAGMAIFPGVLRYSEVSAGAIHHALRFTSPLAQRAYASPGRHMGPNHDVTLPYYGARFRLKADFDDSAYSADTRVLIAALKKYGMIFADQGTGAYITGENNPGFATALLDEINTGTRRIPFDTAHFELVQSRAPIQRGFSPGTVTCNGATANAQPSWQPSWNPSCPAMGNWP